MMYSMIFNVSILRVDEHARVIDSIVQEIGLNMDCQPSETHLDKVLRN